MVGGGGGGGGRAPERRLSVERRWMRTPGEGAYRPETLRLCKHLHMEASCGFFPYLSNTTASCTSKLRQILKVM